MMQYYFIILFILSSPIGIDSFSLLIKTKTLPLNLLYYKDKLGNDAIKDSNDDLQWISNHRRSLPRKALLSTLVQVPLWITSGIANAVSIPTTLTSKALSEEYRQGTAALGDTDSTGPVPRDAYIKLPSGVTYADLRMGKGVETVQIGSRVNIQWVLRKSNGYFVDSSEVNDGIPFIFVVGNGNAILGLEEGIIGMKVGGVRRILIPPSLAYVTGVDDNKPGPIPTGYGPRQQIRRIQSVRKDVPGEYIYLEIQLTRVR